MRVISFSILAALAKVIVAQTPTGNAFNVPPGGYQVEAGKTLDLKWNPTDGDTVTLTLRQGNAGMLSEGTVIQANLPNSGEYMWTVPSDIVSGGDYAIEIKDDQSPTNTNFTPPINVTGGSGTSSSMSITTTSGSSSTTSGTTSTSMTTSTTSASTSTDSTSTSSESSSSSTSSRTSPSTTVPTVNPTETNAAPVKRVDGAFAALVAVGLGFGYAL